MDSITTIVAAIPYPVWVLIFGVALVRAIFRILNFGGAE